MKQLVDLAKPFSRTVIKRNPSGYGDYVSHYVVNQALLAKLGPFSFTIDQIVKGKDPKSNEEVVCAVVCSLTTEVDGQRVTISEAGDAIGGGNWKHDGERVKDGASDALKRCAMRLGLGLHLWAGDEFFLHEMLLKRESEGAGGGSSNPGSAFVAPPAPAEHDAPPTPGRAA